MKNDIINFITQNGIEQLKYKKYILIVWELHPNYIVAFKSIYQNGTSLRLINDTNPNVNLTFNITYHRIQIQIKFTYKEI